MKNFQWLCWNQNNNDFLKQQKKLGEERKLNNPQHDLFLVEELSQTFS